MSRYVLSLAVVIELAALITSVSALSIVAGCLFIGYFTVFLARIKAYSRIIMVVTLSVTGVLVILGRLDQPHLLGAAESAGFYGAFLGSLGMMQCLVRRFEVLRRIHDVLLGGPPMLLYPKYAVTTLGIASVLNFGVMSLLCGTLTGILDERGVRGESRLNWIRSVLISALRGFSLVPLVAPTSVAVAILTQEVPELSWSGLLPYGLTAAALLICVGWVLEQRRFRKVSEERVKLEGWPQGTRTLVVMVSLILGTMAALVYSAGFNVSRAAMIAVPSVTVLYMLWTDRNVASVFREATDNVVSMSNEMAIFAASACLGVALMALVPSDFISGVAAREAGVYLLAVAGLLVLPLFSTVGVIPITTLSVLGGLLPQLTAAGMDIQPIAVALMIGFSLAMMLSPMGPAVLLLSRFGQVRQVTVAFGWNGLFVAAAFPVLLLYLWILV
ncbi:hypothetical protein SAMN05216203_2468 [Marinobacter daqiaonensis]|uniref:Uncharacterized protein n=1 Tax=Marinobacter daqiaonensis TaxID=650891 RepID=A0A1I6IM29_9GAMM|nr:hypothetical protein [Marinobacter daqiaonensis]SFR67778.1 hypothetical protein SAMN05216203_2468 [Marinobacter daqiaonensis]